MEKQAAFLSQRSSRTDGGRRREDTWTTHSRAWLQRGCPAPRKPRAMRSSRPTCLRQCFGLGGPSPPPCLWRQKAGSLSQQAVLGPHLMMLAAAFRSWVRSSGSCMTSSRKLITLHLSSLLVSKSCGEDGRVVLATVFQLPCSGPGPARGGGGRLCLCPRRAACLISLFTGCVAGRQGAYRPGGKRHWARTIL